MNKHLKFFILTTWILFSRSYDAYCTHTLTPDLTSAPIIYSILIGGCFAIIYRWNKSEFKLYVQLNP